MEDTRAGLTANGPATTEKQTRFGGNIDQIDRRRALALRSDDKSGGKEESSKR